MQSVTVFSLNHDPCWIRYTEADVIPCQSDEMDEDHARQALRGAVIRLVFLLKHNTISTNRKKARANRVFSPLFVFASGESSPTEKRRGICENGNEEESNETKGNKEDTKQFDAWVESTVFQLCPRVFVFSYVNGGILFFRADNADLVICSLKARLKELVSDM